MHHSPVAILNKQRQYRSFSQSQSNPHSFGTSAGTPSSLTSSFIDHAFDHPTPTSFSQLQLLGSSVTSNDGSDYTHRVPKLEEQFCSGFNCCGLELDDLHHLLEHFEECHVLSGNGNSPANPAAAAAVAAATAGGGNANGMHASTSNLGRHHQESGQSDMPEFDDFEEEVEAAKNSGNSSNNNNNNNGGGGSNASAAAAAAAAAGIGGNGSGVGPTLSAPPSPAMSSYSDHHSPGSGGGSGGSNAGASSGNPLYELGNKRRTAAGSSNLNIANTANNSNSNINASQSSFPSFNRSSRSPPSGPEDDAVSMHSEDEHHGLTTGHLPFTRRNRQQSVDSLASVSTNASTASKKRNFNTAIGSGSSNNNNNNNNGSGNPPLGMNGHQAKQSSLSGIDFSNIRVPNAGGVGGAARASSGFSTPDSSLPGTPASEHEGIEMPGVGCLPPSLLFPIRHNRNPYSSAEEDMTTDEEDDDSRSFSFDNDAASGTEDEEEEDDNTSNNGNMNDNISFQHFLLQQQQQLYGNMNNNNINNNGAGAMGGNGNMPMGIAPHQMQMMQQHFNNNNNNNGNNQQLDENNFNNFASMLGTTPTAEPQMKKKKTSSAGGVSGLKPKKNKASQRYDATIDSAAAAMFSPLSLMGGHQHGMNGSQIAMPTVAAGSSPSSQAQASAATLAAIQAAAAANAFPDASTPTGRIWVPNNAKPFKCPVPGCDKAYKQQNGLKYHRLHGHCNANNVGKEAEEIADASNEKEEDKPFGCYVGPACGKKYKNMNGLRYHYQHSGAHGQIGLQMLSNGTHPPPAYPPGHKRAGQKNYGAEFSNNPSPTVVMNQQTAQALLAAISHTDQGPLLAAQQQQTPPPYPTSTTSSGANSKNNSRASTPASRNMSPHNSNTRSPMGVHA